MKVSKRQKEKVKLSKAYKVARLICAISFVSLAFVAVSHLVSAINTVNVSNQGGIPSSWGITSAAQPDKITVTMNYFDQVTNCEGRGTGTRQFGFGQCSDNGTTGLQQGLVKDKLGKDGLPVPTYTSTEEAKHASVNYQNTGLVGNDPLRPGDNFYQWYHEVKGKSYKYDLDTIFTRVGNQNKYTYGGKMIFPLDKVEFKDPAQKDYTYNGHNFSFTAHLSVPIRVNMTGEEFFEFRGDDDVWVFLNNQLVLDLGGTHSALDGNFRVNSDGSIDSVAYDGNGKPHAKHIKPSDLNIKEGDVVTMDFFYAERNITESNTLITITGMEWPIVADSDLVDDIINNEKIQYTSSITNKDTVNGIDIERISAYLLDNDTETGGFVPLDKNTLQYTYTPNDLKSWKPVDISAPASSDDGFTLAEPISLSAAGNGENTAYFRYYVAPNSNDINYTSTVGYYTTDAYGDSGIAYDSATTDTDTLHAVPYEYKVNFDSRGGSDVKDQIVQEDNTAARPEDPEYDNHVFVGWTDTKPSDNANISDYTTYDFSTILTSNITLYALWVEVPPEPTYHVVVFDGNGGSQTDPQSVEDGKTATKPETPTRSGYNFAGWTLNGEKYDFSTPVNKDITLVADWEQVIYNVTFDYNYKDAPQPIVQNVASGASALEPAKPTREGYIFLGWTVEDPAGKDKDEPSISRYDFSTPVESDITLVAYWQIIIEEPKEPEVEAPSENPEEKPSKEDNVEVLPGVTTNPSDDITDDTLGDDMLDDTLFTVPDDYLEVLGEALYVPATGVMSSISATLFGNRAFDTVILSQVFVMINLLVFAVSFATMFALRDYADEGKFSPLVRLKALRPVRRRRNRNGRK